MAEGAREKAPSVEGLAELLTPLLLLLLVVVLLHHAEDLLHLLRVAPLVNPPHDDHLVPVALSRECSVSNGGGHFVLTYLVLHLAHNLFFLKVDLIEFAQL